jgi:cytosine/adenosine deaminase-related metal-dependent hydrolase
MRTLLTARHVVGHDNGRHCLIENGEVVIEADRIVFVGRDFPGEVDQRHDFGLSLLGPGLIDLDALSDLDTTILGYDNQPAWEKGRIWPKSYMDRGPYEMYSPDELAFQKRYAFALLLRHGITTALPIASLFYRAWGETPEEFDSAAESAADLGIRAYLGPAYRTGNTYIEDPGIHEDVRIDCHYDEPRGLAELDAAIAFARRHDNTHGGLIRAMLAPDRVETCTPELLRRTAAAVRDLDIPVRLHACQSKLEYDLVLQQHAMSPPEWLASLGFLSPRTLIPHATWVSGARGLDRPGRDLDILGEAGVSIVHCPLVTARGGRALDSFSKYKARGLNIGLGTDTWPPDLLANMQIGALLSRISDGTALNTRAADLYDAATTGGADALHRPDLGRLAPGAQADITVFDLSHPLIGQVIDPIQTLLIGGAGRDVSDVFVAGRHVVQNGVLPGFDLAAAHARAQSQFDGLVAKYPERTWKHPPVERIFTSSYPRK